MIGSITIVPTPKQREASRILQDKDILVYGGGIRSGKSFFLLLRLISYCFQYDNSRWVVLRKDWMTIRRNLFPTLSNILELGIGQYVRSFDRSLMSVKFRNGSELFFMAESYNEDKELNRFKGLEINGAGMDEINEMQEATFNKVIERSGSWSKAGNVPPKIIGTCNPSNGWVKKQFYDRYKKGTLPERWAYVPALITDNPHISPDYLESLKANMPKWEYEVFVNGNWDMKLEGVLYGTEDIKRYHPEDVLFYDVVNGEKVPKFETALAYIDVADEGDDSLCMVIAKCFKGKILITEVIHTQANTDVTLPLCAEAIQRNGVEYCRVEANNQGSVYLKELRKLVGDEKILKVTNSTNKHTRILLSYNLVKEYFYLLDDTMYGEDSDYHRFATELFSYMKDGSSKHDDAPDALSGLVKFVQSFLPHLLTKD